MTSGTQGTGIHVHISFKLMQKYLFKKNRKWITILSRIASNRCPHLLEVLIYLDRWRIRNPRRACWCIKRGNDRCHFNRYVYTSKKERPFQWLMVWNLWDSRQRNLARYCSWWNIRNVSQRLSGNDTRQKCPNKISYRWWRKSSAGNCQRTSRAHPRRPRGRENLCFWHQSEVRTAATVWNWSGKTLSSGALLAVLHFSFVPYFSARLDFPSPPLSAPGSPRMSRAKTVGLRGGQLNATRSIVASKKIMKNSRSCCKV